MHMYNITTVRLKPRQHFDQLFAGNHPYNNRRNSCFCHHNVIALNLNQQLCNIHGLRIT